MNDYLTRMVERAVGIKPAVRPIVPVATTSRPAGGADSPVEEQRGGMEGKEVFFSGTPESTAADAATVPRHHPARDAGVTKPVETPPFTLLSENFPQQLPTKPERPAAVAMERKESLPEAPEPLSAGGATGAKKTQPAVPIEESLLGTQPGQESMNTDYSLFDTASQFIRRRGARQNRELLMGGRENPDSPEWDAEPAGGAAEQEQAVTEPKPIRRAGSVTLHEREHLFTKAVEPAIPAPPESTPSTIKVSIGRVEIRAAVPQTATVESRLPSTPKVSLDEYLRKQPGRTR